MRVLLAIVLLIRCCTATLLCGQSGPELDARMCRELTAVSNTRICVDTDTAGATTFAQAVASADRAASIDYSQVAQQISFETGFDQQQCMYAWRIARCAASFAPAVQEEPVQQIRACGDTCVSLRQACGRQNLGLECGLASDNERPPCSRSFAAIANDECARDRIDEPPAQQRPPAPRTNAPLPTPQAAPRIPLPLPPRIPRRSASSSLSSSRTVACILPFYTFFSIGP